MTVVDGWLTSAFRVPDVRQDKVYSDLNSGAGICWHSQEGYGLQTMINLHESAIQRSFMFWISKVGEIFQFSPVTASVWCSGSYWANTRYWPCELEGTYGEPINDLQIGAALILMDEWATHTGGVVTRWKLPTDWWWYNGNDVLPTMVEHREIDTVTIINAGATACPSERYTPLWDLLEERDMTPEQLARMERLERLLAANGVRRVEDGKIITGEEALAYMDALGTSAYLSISELNRILGEHIEKHPSSEIADHKHEPGKVQK